MENKVMFWGVPWADKKSSRSEAVKSNEERLDGIDDNEPVLSDEEVDNKKEVVGATFWGSLIGTKN